MKLTTIAAALVATASASYSTGEKRETSFWYANLDHTGPYRGYAPELGVNASTYSVYKAVSPGASAVEIQAAINDDDNGGSRHSQWLASQPRVVYIPPGTYEINQTIYFNTDTILMGDATDPPVFKAAADGFTADQTLVSGQDPGTGEQGELSFAVALKNIVLDTTDIDGGTAFTALWWGVAQGAQLQNVKITMASSINGVGHSGIRLGRGSTLGLSDVRIERGQNGIWHNGHQQASYKGIYFYENAVGMLIDGGYTISLLAPTFETVGTAVSCTGGYPWISIVDAKSINSGVTFNTTSYPSFLIENLIKDTDSDVAVVVEGTVLAAPTNGHVDQFSYANTVDRDPIYGGVSSSSARPAALAPGGYYPVIPAPNFAAYPVSDFINIRDPSQNGGHIVLGDNSGDDAAALNAVLAYAASEHKIAYFPFGKYRVDDTLVIPTGSRIVGEAWSTITGHGDAFSDAANPKPVVQVGRAGDVGIAQIQDMRFTVSDVLPGAIVLQFQAAGAAPGDVGLWNSLITVGGTRGSLDEAGECADAADQCRAAFLGIHLAPSSSAYIENVWNWVADHATEGEDSNGSGSHIAAKGGVLVQATRGSWLYALGSEHWWLYQLNLFGASNVVVSLLQSETNYDQGSNAEQVVPAPWTPDATNWGDPDFSWCDDASSNGTCPMGFANYIQGGENIYTYASASWAFFSGPGYQACDGDCQDVVHWITETPDNLQAFGLCSKDTYSGLRLANGTDIITENGFTGSWGGDVGRYTP
ncbi:Glucan endo-1,3-beta-glucosidase BGN13.1 [Pestalotiopsis fici W106-1]|uniref:Glucan endo-1,3-beta-glucosidase BGN13.1 n=1 Tax=Pestalotiopsis fici (strain W106-1 / CGMCC3.15140) TaxID=1229662 RepID=W3WK95_PESFW|nr:Glucan endo-1,3-beta-glucosidase BGN13.1 [Pestalotiopsis fici W106-1]ETS73587.1 Glucan endo-1,3-beta-glucosidase BGN13.1 [Pestalotiopsis fici W106-1]